MRNESKYLVQICSQAKGRRKKLPEVHSVDKGINSDIKPERQILKSQKSVNKPKLGQGRESLRSEIKVPVQVQVQIKEENQTRNQNLIKQKEGLQVSLTRQTTVRNIEQETENDTIPKHISKPTVTKIKIPMYPDPLMKPPPRLPDVKTQDDRKINLDLDLEINKDFEVNAPYQEGIISEIYQRPDRFLLLKPTRMLAQCI